MQTQDHPVFGQLAGLRTELADLAFMLECKGLFEAADVALAASARVGELCDEHAPAGHAGGAKIRTTAAWRQSKIRQGVGRTQSACARSPRGPNGGA